MKKIKKMFKKIHYKNIDKLARFHTKIQHTYIQQQTVQLLRWKRQIRLIYLTTKSFLTVKIVYATKN